MQRFNAACCVTTADILVLLPSFHLVIAHRCFRKGIQQIGSIRSRGSEQEMPGMAHVRTGEAV